jgi:hypothetical protein
MRAPHTVARARPDTARDGDEAAAQAEPLARRG